MSAFPRSDPSPAPPGGSPLERSLRRRLQLRGILGFKRHLLPHLVPDLTGRTLAAVDATDPDAAVPVRVTVGPRLGFGTKGAVYRLARIAGHPNVPDVPGETTPYVVKVAHRLRGTGWLRDRFEADLREELSTWRALLAALPAMRADPVWPDGAPWPEDALPVARIAAVADSGFGLALVKPEVRGRFLEDLADDLAAKGPLDARALPDAMRESLHHWYALSQCATRHAKVPGPAGTTRPIRCLDLNPENLVWIEDPVHLAHLGLDPARPGFVAVELGEPRYITYRDPSLGLDADGDNVDSAEAYVETFVSFLRRVRR